MTATRKLFIAAVLLTAGFGVARLMGRPAAHWYVPQSGGVTVVSQNATIAAKSSTSAAPAALITTGARLVPDFGANNPYQVSNDSTASSTAQMPLNDINTGSVTIAPPALPANQHDRAASPGFERRAKLRNEAPRPLDIQSRAPAIVYARPTLPTHSEEFAAAPEARSASTDWRASGLRPAEFVQDATNVATINASYSQPFELSTAASPVAPPPWPELAEANEPRTHIIVDGDSLQKLAGRYLDDPSRGNDIYEANRELLANPDLLPIGAPLVIPKLDAREAIDGSSPQSSLTNDSSLRAALNRGMVPVRPIPSTVGVMPRAQLLPPIPFE